MIREKKGGNQDEPEMGMKLGGIYTCKIGGRSEFLAEASAYLCS